MDNTVNAKTIIAEFLKDVGLKRIKSESEFYSQFSEASGEDTAVRFMTASHDRYNGTLNDTQVLYEAKNATMDGSLIVSSYYDYQPFIAIFEWILENKQLISGKILEIGCDCGIVSCFLGKMFPELEITSIDLCEKAVQNAMELSKRLNINNISFRVCGLKDITETYDTVFSIRVADEFIIGNPDYSYMDFLEAAEAIASVPGNYFSCINHLLNKDGEFIAFENTVLRFPASLGYIIGLNAEGISFAFDNQKMVFCEYGDDNRQYYAFTAKNTGCVLSKEELIKLYVDKCLRQNMSFDKNEYETWEARIVKEFAAGKVLFEEKNTERNYLIGVYENKFNKKRIIEYLKDKKVSYASQHKLKQLDKVVNRLKKQQLQPRISTKQALSMLEDYLSDE